jgi:hypothetical protein
VYTRPDFVSDATNTFVSDATNSFMLNGGACSSRSITCESSSRSNSISVCSSRSITNNILSIFLVVIVLSNNYDSPSRTCISRWSVDTIKNTHLKPSCHRTGTKTVAHPTQKVTYVIRGFSSPPQEPDPTKRARATFPKQTQPRCAHTMGQDFPSLTPVRGLTRPSIPPPFHWS